MKKFIAAFMAIASVTIGTIFVFAQQGENGEKHFKRGFGHRGGFGFMAKKLNLTDAQKEQVKQIMETSKSKIKPLKENMKSIRQQMETATADGQFDEARVQALATQQANTMAQMIVEKERTKSQFFAILTPEQQAQAKQLKEQMKERFKGKFQRKSKGESS